MPNQNRNGLQDLDILDLDDLLSEEDTSAAEKPQEEKKKTAEKPQAETKKAADKPQAEKKKAADKPQQEKAAEAPDEEDGDASSSWSLFPEAESLQQKPAPRIPPVIAKSRIVPGRRSECSAGKSRSPCSTKRSRKEPNAFRFI